MVARFFLFLAFLAFAAEAFAPRVAFAPRSSTVASPTTAPLVQPLFACRTNAKKEKSKRNRENMRKFKKTGRRGVSRRKMMKKALASKARQEEAEFIAKCFITVPTGEEETN